METPLDNGQTLKDESIQNQTTSYKYTTSQNYDQTIKVTLYEGNVEMKVKPIKQNDPDKYGWEQLNLTQVIVNDANGSAYKVVRTPKLDEDYALFSVNCQSQNITTECTSIYDIQIQNTNDTTLISKGAYELVEIRTNVRKIYQFMSDDTGQFKIIFQYRNCTYTQLIKEGKDLVICQLTPKIDITYYLSNDTHKTEHTVDLANMTIVTQKNDFLIITQEVQNATYTVTLTNTQDNETIYCGVFFEDSINYNEVTLLSERNLLGVTALFTEVFSPQNYMDTYLLQVEISECSNSINSYMSDQFGLISFDDKEAVKLIPNKYKYCSNLANELELVDNPIYLKFQSTNLNVFLLQLNYVPLGVENAYNCLYPGSDGAISIDKSDTQEIKLTISQIQKLSSCNTNSFTYKIKGYWLAFAKEEAEVACSLKVQSGATVTYLKFFEPSVSGSFDPSKKLLLSIPYNTLSTKQDDSFFVGIKALVLVSYSGKSVIENNYTFTYQFESFNLVVTPVGKPHSSGLSGAQKAGIAIGVILGFGLIGGLALWFIRRKHKRQDALIHYEQDF